MLPMDCRAVSILLAMFSLCIVLAEATISGSLPNMSVFSRVLHHTAQNQFVTELLTFLFLCYPCLCAYYAIFKLGRFNFYLLVPRWAVSYDWVQSSDYVVQSCMSPSSPCRLQKRPCHVMPTQAHLHEHACHKSDTTSFTTRHKCDRRLLDAF